ncbi:hypothetical protein [Desulfotalea psychrophila]|uniref:Uncharacterized protein n=1 Tax=Desulfotalea psychrophila (strain LSv54 / DSM 12343) TaxID=177439 RepID=Q6ARY9_DESPS|nr:hypothetical protein [Desulfotalea psychrophila]CAG34886.1 unknown protein [Desulfotalea psychrophila LSv54]
MRVKIYPSLVALSLLLMAMTLSSPTASCAHGTGYRIVDNDDTVTMEFYYSTGSLMPYAEVLIFSPTDKESEYQNGRTDRRGRFAFRPNSPGEWQIKVYDGRGHKVNGKCSVTRADETDSPLILKSTSAKTVPKRWGVILGISLIFNLCGAIALFNKKRQKKA